MSENSFPYQETMMTTTTAKKKERNPDNATENVRAGEVEFCPGNKMICVVMKLEYHILSLIL